MINGQLNDVQCVDKPLDGATYRRKATSVVKLITDWGLGESHRRKRDHLNRSDPEETTGEIEAAGYLIAHNTTHVQAAGE